VILGTDCNDDKYSPNHEGEECGESYSRMIFLQIMRERSVARAIPG
jgi:hypothetical protein